MEHCTVHCTVYVYILYTRKGLWAYEHKTIPYIPHHLLWLQDNDNIYKHQLQKYKNKRNMKLPNTFIIFRPQLL